MNYFSPVPLTSSGRIIFIHEEEVELKSFVNVSVLEVCENHVTQVETAHSLFEKSNSVVLTNVRLIVLVNNANSKSHVAWGFYLKSLSSFEDQNKGSFLRRSKRVRLFMANDSSVSQAPPSQQRKALDFKFLEGDKEVFLEYLQKAMERKSWEYILNKVSSNAASSSSSTSSSLKVASFSVKNAGISGIIRRQEENIKNMDNLTETALTDLNHLIDKAREVVTTVQRYAQLIQENNSAKDISDTASETTTQVNERYEMEAIMQEIGIVSPVTKLSSGRSYHQQLAREICDLLLSSHRLERLGGLITLPDLFCLVNKLHGTELVSPQDLLQASQYIESLDLGIKLRIFEHSQVKALQLVPKGREKKEGGADDNIYVGKVMSIMESNENALSDGITIHELMQSLNSSFVIVKELLKIMEERQILCRDESIEGVRYFPNLFTKFSVSLSSVVKG
jgi:ESCRT-II complex subunit VPS36